VKKLRQRLRRKLAIAVLILPLQNIPSFQLGELNNRFFGGVIA
jgi:hypothetical protein